MLQQQDAQMTATEVMARLEERLTIFAPTFGRLTNELFDPMLNRVYGLLLRAGKLPELPDELRDYPDYEIVYISKLALAIKLMEMKAFGDMLQYMSPMMSMDPAIADNYDFDAVAQAGADRFGIPTEFLRSVEERDELRAARAEQQQQEQMAAMAAQAAMSPNATKSIEPNSPLSLMGGLAGG
jgi:hypothetical protein